MLKVVYKKPELKEPVEMIDCEECNGEGVKDVDMGEYGDQLTECIFCNGEGKVPKDEKPFIIPKTKK